MKKIIIAVVLMSSLGFAGEYYSKLNPIKTYNVKSAVSGKVLLVNSDLESKNVDNSKLLSIDSQIDQEDLKQSKIKLQNLKDILTIQKGILGSYQKVSSKSKFDKDNQKITILNISSNISDLETKIATLKDTLTKKTLYVKKEYIYDIAVEVGDYVTPGVLLYTSMDLSAGKLEIFVPIDTAKELRNKTIFLDGKKTDLKISKLYAIADTTHISSYKCEIIVPSPQTFSNLVKIEFR